MFRFVGRVTSRDHQFQIQFLLLHVIVLRVQIPEAEASVQDVAIDQDGTYMAAVNNKGHCYIWTLTGGVGDEPTRLNPRHKLSAHKRYALRCKFSPDST